MTSAPMWVHVINRRHKGHAVVGTLGSPIFGRGSWVADLIILLSVSCQ